MEYIQIIFLCLATIINVFHCTKADSDKETILSLLNNTAGLQRYNSWSQDIDGLNNESSTFTVFAFNDAGYETLPSEEREILDQLDSKARNEYVKDFIVNRLYDISQLHDGLELSSISGKHLYVNKKNYTKERPQGIVTTYIDGVPITGEGLQASNGIIHILGRPPGPIGDMTMLDFVQTPNKVDNSTLLADIIERLMRVYFVDALLPLEQEDPVTFFLPSLETVEKLPHNDLASLSDEYLAKVFKMNFIPGHAVFTEPVEDFQSFQSKNLRETVTFYKERADVYVRGGGVTAMITTANIRATNGVIHVTNKMLGFIYQTALEQIQEDARIFGQLIRNASMGTIQLVTSPTGVIMFVPLDSAFDGLDVESWNQSVIDMVVKLCLMRDGSLSVSQISGDGYEKRLRRTSYYNNSTLVIYKDKDGAWVNGGNIRARVVSQDVRVTNGQLQYIDRVLGLPTMDIPALIYEDGELSEPYSELKKVHLVSYLADPLYNRSQGQSHIDSPSLDPPSDTHSTLHTNESFWCDESCLSNSTDDVARCQFTVFLPSSKAFENFYNTTDGANVTQDLCRYRYVLRRHIIPNRVISLEEMAVSATGQSYITDNGDEIKVRKDSPNDVIVIWGQTSARVILWDLGATNGIIHIIDAIWTDTEDLTVDIGPATSTLKSTTTTSTKMSTTTLHPSSSITTSVSTVKTTVAVSEGYATVPLATLIYFVLFSLSVRYWI